MHRKMYYVRGSTKGAGSGNSIELVIMILLNHGLENTTYNFTHLLTASALNSFDSYSWQKLEIGDSESGVDSNGNLKRNL